MPVPSSADRQSLVLLAALLVAAVVFSLWPGLDLAVSAFFYTPGSGFALEQSPPLVATRWAIWYLAEATVALALAGSALALFRRRLLGLQARIWGFVVLLFALGPGLLVNGLLKSYWGRARPADIVPFGGTQSFTPALQPADQCASNCSFVSGEGASSVAFAIAAIVVLSAFGRRLPEWVRRAGVSLAVIIGFTGAALRVATGRHFLSDTVFAALFVAAIALILHRVLRLSNPQ